MCQWAPGDAGKPDEHTFHDDPQAHELALENQRELAAQAAALEAAAKEMEHYGGAFADDIRALIKPDQRTALQAALDAARLPLIEALQLVIKTSEDYGRINNLSGAPVWENIAREALERVRASRETKEQQP